MRKALLVFAGGARNGLPGQWHVTFFAEDTETSIGRPLIVKDLESLVRMVDKMRGNGVHVRTSVFNWGEGSEWVELSDDQCKFLGIE